MGLGLVGIDELAVGPASSQILALQPRPYETEAVSGAITVEFVFIEGAEVPAGRRPYKFKEALKITNPAQLNGMSRIKIIKTNLLILKSCSVFFFVKHQFINTFL